MDQIRTTYAAARRLYRVGAHNPQRPAFFGDAALTNEQARANGMVAGLHPRAAEGLWPCAEQPMVSTLRSRYQHANQPGYHGRAIRDLRTALNFRNVALYRFGRRAGLSLLEVHVAALRLQHALDDARVVLAEAA